MKRSLLATMIVLLGVGEAYALPANFVQQGYAVDDLGPMQGPHTVRLRIYEQLVGGAVVFEEVMRDGGW